MNLKQKIEAQRAKLLAECATDHAYTDYTDACDAGNAIEPFEWSASVMPDEGLLDLTVVERADYNKIYAKEWNRLRLQVKEYVVRVGKSTRSIYANSSKEAVDKMAQLLGYDGTEDMTLTLMDSAWVFEV